MALLFRLGNLLVLPFRALMILLPRRRWTVRIMRSPFVSAAPALFYAALVLPRLGAIWPAIARPTLPGVAALLGSLEGTTIAWVHFLAFDLFIGRWIYLDSQERRLSALLRAPVSHPHARPLGIPNLPCNSRGCDFARSRQRQHPDFRCESEQERAFDQKRDTT